VNFTVAKSIGEQTIPGSSLRSREAKNAAGETSGGLLPWQIHSAAGPIRPGCRENRDG
jgi:hypothetical protein